MYSCLILNVIEQVESSGNWCFCTGILDHTEKKVYPFAVPEKALAGVRKDIFFAIGKISELLKYTLNEKVKPLLKLRMTL